jgi:hypothetical protein
VAAITNHHKPEALKQQKFVLSQFWNQYYWDEIKVSAGPPCPLRGPRENLSLATSSIPWLVAAKL